MWLLALAALLVPAPQGRPLRLFLACTVVSFVSLVYVLRAADDVGSIERYFTSIQLPFDLAVVLGALSYGASAPGRRRTIVRAIAVVAVGAHVGVELLLKPTLLDFARAARLVAAEFSGAAVADRHRLEEAADAHYRAIQESVPVGAPMLVMLDQPHRFDFRRNRIMNFDTPGAVSPAPHIPIGEGPEAMARYLVSVGARYVAFSISDDSPEYQMGDWVRRATEPPPTRDGRARGAYLQSQARFYVDIFRNLEALVSSRANLFSDGPTHVLDLATSVPLSRNIAGATPAN